MGMAELLFLNTIDLRQLDVLLLELCRHLLIFWGKGLAVTAPWGED